MDWEEEGSGDGEVLGVADADEAVSEANDPMPMRPHAFGDKESAPMQAVITR